MLQIEYINSFHHDYLKLKAKAEEGNKPWYQQQIISTKKLEGLLPAMLYAKNGEFGLYYDVSSLQGLDKWLLQEKISEKWMDKLVYSLQTALWSLKEYLLDSRNLIMRPDSIFVHAESEKMFFLYYPYYVEEEKQDIGDLLSLLIESVEEKEPDTAAFLYCIFAKWDKMQDCFKPEDMVSLWINHRREKEENNDNASGTNKNSVDTSQEQSVCESACANKPEFVVERKRDLSEVIFGRHRKIKEKDYPNCIAAENWEYKADEKPEDR